MDIMPVIKARRSVRRFHSTPLKQEDLSLILEAGTFAPSGGNSQTTHFFVIENPDVLTRLRQTAVEEFAQMEVYEGMYKSLVSTIRQSREKGMGYDFLYGAPVLVLLANKKGYGNAMADCALAAENMFLQATAMGIGSCYINQIHWLTENPRMLQVLQRIGLPEDELIFAGAAFGYSAMGEQTPLQRFGNPITYIK